jgi:hypothetical protein
MPLPHLKLPLTFDPRPLQDDVSKLTPEDWRPHFNQRQYEGDWSGVALRGNPGSHMPLFPDPTRSDFVDLPVLDRCPNIRNVLAAFQCPLHIVRLLRLSAGSVIREHSDFDLSYEDGNLRLHIPVFTNPKVEFAVASEPLPLREGECWYINFSLPHRIHNLGDTDRIHLVIDCELNPWLDTMFPKCH